MKSFLIQHRAFSLVLRIFLIALGVVIALCLWYFVSNYRQIAKDERYNVRVLRKAEGISLTEYDGSTAETSRPEDIETFMRCIKRLKSNLVFAIPSVASITPSTKVVFTFEDGSTVEYSYRCAAETLGSKSPFAEFYKIPHILEQLESTAYEQPEN